MSRMPGPPSRRRAVAHCAFVVLTTLVCAALLGAAALVPAPPPVLLGVIALSLAAAMTSGVVLPSTIAMLRGASALYTLRRHLDELPEAPHPLGL
jgi:hypothetical protein